MNNEKRSAHLRRPVHQLGQRIRNQHPAEMIHYGVTKSAQISLARGLAETTVQTGITVNSILPGPTLSEGVGTSEALIKWDTIGFSRVVLELQPRKGGQTAILGHHRLQPCGISILAPFTQVKVDEPLG